MAPSANSVSDWLYFTFTLPRGRCPSNSCRSLHNQHYDIVQQQKKEQLKRLKKKNFMKKI
ncbi:hypothetical protein X777_00582 [Ooceraea biroi]|uniref:Uncharacterized protein n=1 Tax=Ooceraea biroi TaxID=2015173 RepID=A0A026VVS0_OOCBI|nr:hypothetical protein X777_00582 [Ooceraea biroi]